MERGADVLAAYADGTVRYVNHSGKAIVWEITDATIADIVRKLLESCKDLRGVVVAASASYCCCRRGSPHAFDIQREWFLEAPMHSWLQSNQPGFGRWCRTYGQFD